MPWRLLTRDLALVVLTAVCCAFDARLRARGGAPLGLGVASGFLLTLSAYLTHEWGHYLAARSARAVVYPARSIASVFLFAFDADRNDRRQFLTMSAGGFAASALVVAGFLAWLPLDAWSGRIALALTLVGVAATFVLEIPVAWRVARGAALPRTGAVYRAA